MTKLYVKDIVLSYDKVKPIISNLSFEAKQGECILIEGRNGIGKTTLLKAIGGLLKPISGTITVNDVNIYNIPITQRRFLVSYSQQSPSYSTPIKLIEFLEMALTSKGYLLGWRRIKRFIRLLEIEELLLEPINTLSEGQKKLALLARTFIQDSNIILLDEPESFLDTYNQKLLINAIKELLQEDKIVLFVSHNIHFSNQILTKRIKILSPTVFNISQGKDHVEFITQK